MEWFNPFENGESSSQPIVIDNQVDENSENPVQNKAIYGFINSTLQAMTQAEYDALITKSAPLYFIYEEE